MKRSELIKHLVASSVSKAGSSGASRRENPQRRRLYETLSEAPLGEDVPDLGGAA